MDEQKNGNGQTSQEIRIRFAIACPRSGSTLLMRAFSESPQCIVTSRLVFMENHSKGVGFTPDYSILQRPETHPAYKAAIPSAISGSKPSARNPSMLITPLASSQRSRLSITSPPTSHHTTLSRTTRKNISSAQSGCLISNSGARG